MVPVPKLSKWKVLLALFVVVGLVSSVLTLVLVRHFGRPESNLSSETLDLIEKSVDVCSAEEVYPIGCAPSSWNACLAQQKEAARGIVARYLCDSAVMAETGELAFALAYRYGREFYPRVSIDSSGRPVEGGEHPVFYLFHESLRYWEAYLSLSPVPHDVYNGVIIFGWLRTQRGRLKPLGGFSEVSDADLAQLKSLEEAIDGLYSPYSAYSPSEPNWHVNSPVLSSFEAAVPTASSLVPASEVVRVCQDAITAARLDDPMWQRRRRNEVSSSQGMFRSGSGC